GRADVGQDEAHLAQGSPRSAGTGGPVAHLGRGPVHPLPQFLGHLLVAVEHPGNRRRAHTRQPGDVPQCRHVSQCLPYVSETCFYVYFPFPAIMRNFLAPDFGDTREAAAKAGGCRFYANGPDSPPRGSSGAGGTRFAVGRLDSRTAPVRGPRGAPTANGARSCGTPRTRRRNGPPGPALRG